MDREHPEHLEVHHAEPQLQAEGWNGVLGQVKKNLGKPGCRISPLSFYYCYFFYFILALLLKVDKQNERGERERREMIVKL